MYVCGDVFECFRRNTLVKCGDEPAYGGVCNGIGHKLVDLSDFSSPTQQKLVLHWMGVMGEGGVKDGSRFLTWTVG